MIETAAGEKIVSSITTTSAKNLGLKVGGKAYAIIKATNVMIGIEDKDPRLFPKSQTARRPFLPRAVSAFSALPI